MAPAGRSRPASTTSRNKKEAASTGVDINRRLITMGGRHAGLQAHDSSGFDDELGLTKQSSPSASRFFLQHVKTSTFRSGVHPHRFGLSKNVARFSLISRASV